MKPLPTPGRETAPTSGTRGGGAEVANPLLPKHRVLRDAPADAEADDTIKVAVIAGAPGAFSAGQDLSEMGAARNHDDGEPPGFGPFLDRLSTFRKPLLVAVRSDRRRTRPGRHRRGALPLGAQAAGEQLAAALSRQRRVALLRISWYRTS